MHHRLIQLTVCLMTYALADAQVVLETDHHASTIKVSIRGRHFTTYHHGGERHMPYLWPVMGEGGVGITRNFPMAEDEPAIIDHPHHLSLYLAYGDLNGFDFWHDGRGNPGIIRTTDIQTGQSDGFAWIRGQHPWIAKEDGKIVVEETRELRFHDTPENARIIDIISTFHAAHGDVTFGDTKEGMLAARVRPDIDGQHGGMLTNAEGLQGEANVYGTPSPWIDYSGHVEGHGRRGVAIFDHPGNIRPGFRHVRDFGLSAINPFGRHAVGGGENGAYTLADGESLTLRYRILIHSSDSATITAHHARYTALENARPAD